MPRIRSIKPEFFTSEQIVECSTNARLLFVGLWCFCDDGGVHPASIKRAKMEVFPGDKFTEAQISAMVAELIDNELLLEFSNNGATYWYVTGWHHQKIDRPNLKYPRPPQFDEHSSNARGTIVEQSPPDVDVDVEGIGGDAARSLDESSNRKFSRPTTEQVKAYCLERRNGIDPQKFVDHYTSNGWRVGKSPMRDWKAAVRTWERNNIDCGKPKAMAKPLTAEQMKTGTYNPITGEVT